MSYVRQRSLSLLGTFSTRESLQTAYPAQSNPGCIAYVGSIEPYRTYVSQGAKWVDQTVVNKSSDLVDEDDISLLPTMGIAGKDVTLYTLEAPLVLPPRLQVGANGGITMGVFNTTITLTFSAIVGAGVTVTASAAFFTSTAADKNKYITLSNGDWAQVTAVTDSTNATVILMSNGPSITAGLGPHSNWYYGRALPGVYGSSGYDNVYRCSLGCWIYFQANALYSGSLAGSYWTVMKSPTQGVVFNTNPSGNLGDVPKVAATKIVSPAMGEQALPVAVYTIGGTTVVPRGIMGTSGHITAVVEGSLSSTVADQSATKFVSPYLGGGYSARGLGKSPSYIGYGVQARWNARGTYSILGPAQGYDGSLDVYGGHGNGIVANTGYDMDFIIKAGNGSADDYITVDTLRLTLHPGQTGNRALRSPVTLPITVPSDFMGMNLMEPGYLGSDLSSVAKVGVNRLNQSGLGRWLSIETSQGVYNQTVMNSLSGVVSATKAKGGKVALGLYGTPTFYAGTTPHPTYTDAQTKGPWGYLGECSNPTNTAAVVNFITYMINYFNKPGGAWYDANGGKKGIDYWETWNEPEHYVNSNGNAVGIGEKGAYFWWGSSTQLVDLCKLQYDLVKSLDSTITVWSPGFANPNLTAHKFLSCKGATYPNTTGGETFDQFSFHTYSAAPPGEVYRPYGSGDIISATHGLHAQLTLLKINGYNHPVTIGEIGFDPKGETDSLAWYTKSAAQRYTYWCRVAMVCAAWGVQSILPWHWRMNSNSQGTAGNWATDTDGCTKAYNDIHAKLCGKTIVAYSYENNSPVRLDFSDGTYWVV